MSYCGHQGYPQLSFLLAMAVLDTIVIAKHNATYDAKVSFYFLKKVV